MSGFKRTTVALSVCYTNSEFQVEIEEKFIAELRLGGEETFLEFPENDATNMSVLRRRLSTVLAEEIYLVFHDMLAPSSGS